MSGEAKGGEISAAARLVRVMDEHLDFLERVDGALERRPSDGQGFRYVSDLEGFIKIRQDSAFIAQLVFVSGPGVLFGTALTYTLGIRDLSSGNVVTIAKMRTDLTTTGRIGDKEFPQVPIGVFTPVTRGLSNVGGNYDYVYRLSADWQIPRGAALRIETSSPFTAYSGFPFRSAPAVILVGYNVSG